MSLTLNPDWQNKNLRCCICDGATDVKYLTPYEKPVCNRCALFYELDVEEKGEGE